MTTSIKSSGASAAAIGEISVEALAKLNGSNPQITVIDVRTPAEFSEIRSTVVSANIPLDQICDAALAAKGFGDKKKSLYVICRSGARSMKACEILAGLGYLQLTNVTGGTSAWSQAGLPVTSG